MKRKLFSALLFGALVASSTSTFVSCKDYDDDIQNLQTQIDANSKAIQEIQKLIQSGSVITNVDPITNGVKVTLSNGNSFNITNGKDGANGTNGTNGADGKDGKDGSVITIGTNGNWFIDGKDTGMAAQGPKGDKGDKGDQGDPGVPGQDGEDAIITAHVWVLSDDLLELIEYKDGVATGNKVSIETLIGNGNNQQPQVVVSALMTNDNLVLYGVQGSSTPISISLSGNLRSLVYMPKLYLDGIETTEYRWLKDTVLWEGTLTPVQTLTTTYPRLAGKTVEFKACGDSEYKKYHVDGKNYLPDMLANNPTTDPVNMPTIYRKTKATKNSIIIYGADQKMEYHMNPSNSNTVYKDIKGYNVLEPSIVNMHTRAAASTIKVTSPEKYWDGTALFSNANGILTTGLNVYKPEQLKEKPTILDVNEGANTIALQARTTADNGDDAIITSDYALLMPTKSYLCGLIWKRAPQYAYTGTAQTGDEYARTNNGCKQCNEGHGPIHVWDSPMEALNDNRGAALELPYFDANGIKLIDWLGIEYVTEDFKTGKQLVKTMTKQDMLEFGLNFEFNFVDYKVRSNNTYDSHYLRWACDESVARKEGHVRAWNVKYDGKLSDDESETSIDRMPLVQVLVKDEVGNVLLDGYVLIHICKGADLNEMVDDYPAQTATFDLCNAVEVFKTNWSQWNDYMLTKGLDNMTKEYFDKNYEADGTVMTSIDPNTTLYDMTIYKDTVLRGNGVPESPALGQVQLSWDTKGTTNHAFKWTISEAEAEKLLHDNGNKPVTITRYIRFMRRSGSEAKWGYIYVKMVSTISRKQIGSAKWIEKINNYWYGANGESDGETHVAFDAKEPIDNTTLVQFNRNIISTLIQNKVQFTAKNSTFKGVGPKFYFEPTDKTVAGKEFDVNTGTFKNVTYTITAKSSATDTRYKTLYCKYINESHPYNHSTLSKLLNECAIDYTRGTFANENLYVYVNNTYTLIATMNQTNGEISLINNDVTKKVLNAVGYVEGNRNIDKEMRALVGVVSSTGCDVAEDLVDHSFTVSWERPINFDEAFTDNTVDARTNATTIYVIDYIKDKFYDWRGKKDGYMHGDQQWFWGYYDINGLTLDMNPAHIYTNLHNGTTFKKLNEISRKVELYGLDIAGTPFRDAYTYNFDCTWANSAAKNSLLLADMETNKSKYGVIYYQNNGDNVDKFTVRIPMCIHYVWGSFWTTLELTIDTTLGN